MYKYPIDIYLRVKLLINDEGIMIIFNNTSDVEHQ